MKKNLILAAVAGLLMSSTAVRAADVEVLHYWTSGGEAAAISVLKQDLESKGIGWQDFAVAGGGGENAKTALKARVSSGSPPTAAALGGHDVKEFAGEGLLGDIGAVAQEGGWDAVLPDEIKTASAPDGTYVGVPFNIHRPNWVWGNAKLFADNGLSLPTTWDEFFAVGDALKEKGIIPLALGGQDWQETIVFEDAVVAVGGPDFYRTAFVELDPEALNSEQMAQSFDLLRKILGYVDPGFPGRNWNDATGMVIRGEAAMQLMGDWAKGEIVAADLVPGVDILCAAAPGTSGTYLWHADFFGFFEAEGEAKAAQEEMARSIMDPKFQETFNIAKGSIPARLDVPMDNFDQCAKDAALQIKEAIDNQSLIPDIGGVAQPASVQLAIQDVVTQFVHSEQSSQDAVAALVKAIDSSK